MAAGRRRAATCADVADRAGVIGTAGPMLPACPSAPADDGIARERDARPPPSYSFSQAA
ncbi:hypothetical protein I546_4654 [Mycobacterium kansasii 732]|nr:hypothetical protein I546_4654 [Mycobacterium kansasii 732]